MPTPTTRPSLTGLQNNAWNAWSDEARVPPGVTYGPGGYDGTIRAGQQSTGWAPAGLRTADDVQRDHFYGMQDLARDEAQFRTQITHRQADPRFNAMKEAEGRDYETAYYNNPAGRASMQSLRDRTLQAEATKDLATSATSESQAGDYFGPKQSAVRSDVERAGREQNWQRYGYPATQRTEGVVYTADARTRAAQDALDAKAAEAWTRAAGGVAGKMAGQPGGGPEAMAYLDRVLQTVGQRNQRLTWPLIQQLAHETGSTVSDVVRRAQDANLPVDTAAVPTPLAGVNRPKTPPPARAVPGIGMVPGYGTVSTLPG